MQFSLASYKEIAASFAPEWSRRSRAEMVAKYGPGCFVWDAKKDGIQNSGMFYARDMVPDYFSEPMASGLQELIDQAEHKSEVVAAMIFGEKAIGLRLRKTQANEVHEVSAPIIH